VKNSIYAHNAHIEYDVFGHALHSAFGKFSVFQRGISGFLLDSLPTRDILVTHRQCCGDATGR
jgi:hypothetical protein